MKFSTILSVFAVALTFAMTGCRYDKAGGAGGDGSAEGMDIAGSEEMDGDIDGVGVPGFDELYSRCTDVDFAPVYFGFDSTVVPDGELAKVDAVVQHLADKTDRVVIVEGHCDERGSNEYNMSLGENRAIIIRNYLVQGGVDASRIQTRSYGEEKPAATGNDESAWAKNRRGEFAVFQK